MDPETPDTAHQLRVLTRGVPIILACTALVALAAVLLTQRQEPRYEASTEVFLELSAVGASIAELQQEVPDPERALATQAAVARIPAVLSAAVRQVPQAR